MKTPWTFPNSSVSLNPLKSTFEEREQDDPTRSQVDDVEDILDVYLQERHHQDPIICVSTDGMDTVSALSSDEFETNDVSDTHKFGCRNVWTIRVQDEYYEEGDTLYFQLIPKDRSTSMILEGKEILESTKALIADDSDVVFVVRTQFYGVTAIMYSSEVLNFLSSMVGSNTPFFRKQQETSKNHCEGDQNVEEDDGLKATMVDMDLSHFSCRISLWVSSQANHTVASKWGC